MAALAPFQEQLRGMKSKPATWFITYAPKHEDSLLDGKEDVFDKIKSFMGGAQREIYDDARDTVTSQSANIDYVDDAAGETLRAVLADPDCFKGTSIQTLKTDLVKLKNKVELKVLEERNAVIEEVQEVSAKIAQMPDFQALDADKKARITARIDNHKTGLETVMLIPVLRDRANGARTNLLSDVVAEIDRFAHPEPEDEPKDDVQPIKKVPKTVLASGLKVKASKTVLTYAGDVDQNLQEMKTTLLEQIRAGKKVIV
jgi:hypothetical protein